MANGIGVTTKKADFSPVSVVGIVIRTSPGGVQVDSGSTSGAGSLLTGTTLANGDYTATAAKAGWTVTSTNPMSVVLSGGSFLINFFLELATALECFRPVSSWVHEVCWMPGRGIRVQFHKNRVPYFRCLYPGTTYAMFELFTVFPSKGQFVNRFLKHRMYVRE